MKHYTAKVIRPVIVTGKGQPVRNLKGGEFDIKCFPSGEETTIAVNGRWLTIPTEAVEILEKS